MKIAIANFSTRRQSADDSHAFWAAYEPPPRPAARLSLLDQPHDWGFHITALGVFLLDAGLASDVELWIEGETRGARYDAAGVLRVNFVNADDVGGYVARHGAPDLFINYGREGGPILARLDGHSFRVHAACLRAGVPSIDHPPAECYLVDERRFVDRRSMLYVPVVNTRAVHPNGALKVRDFIYLASLYQGKRHDLLLDAVRGTSMSGHLHPVDGTALDLSGTRITTSNWNERDVVELLQTSSIAVYPGDFTSNPAAMWECVAAGLPIVVNRHIRGGQHIVVPGATGELAKPSGFRRAMEKMIERRDRYRPHEYFAEHWDTMTLLERYVTFFESCGWRARR